MAYYYRSWNLVVHEWLYTYIYRDISNLVGFLNFFFKKFQKKFFKLGSTTFGNALAQMSVFFISAVFHEYWFTVSLRMFYPIIFFLYFVIGGFFLIFRKFFKNFNFILRYYLPPLQFNQKAVINLECCFMVEFNVR